jgi:ribosomal protein S18 acetylase RimI-like enzyme
VIPVVTVTRATPQQVPLVHALLTEAAGWLQAHGIDQWPCPFPEHIVRASVDRQDTYLAWQANDLIGTLAIYWEDVTFWGHRPPDAGYVHRLAVAGRARGQGFGARLLDWGATQAAAHHRKWLRLDCGTANTSLRTFYQRLGFQHVGDIEVNVPGAGSTNGPWRASLYQRASAPNIDQ